MSINVGLIGYGLSGSVFHAPLIDAVDGLTLTGVVTSRTEEVRRDYPDVPVFHDVEPLLASGVQLVVVASPNTLHEEHARKAILAGKHVVVEKPFTITSEEGAGLIALAKENGVMLTVFQNRRWDNDFLTIRQVLDSGALGRISLYEAHYDRFSPEVNAEKRWRERALPGSGILYDLGAHLIDQALVLFGLPDSVQADLRREREGAQAVDSFHVILGYRQTRVIVRAGSLVRMRGPRYVIHGDTGSFMKSGLDPQEEQLKRGLRPADPDWGCDKPESYGELTTSVGELTAQSKVETVRGSYESFYRGVVEAISSGAPAPVLPEEALETIRIIEAAERSAEQKRTILLTEQPV
ncbi:oxidoreductase [Paenibacillus beijingensis]|uniref:Oxidoreductase n=1 Tax=Paenibacillus beijingensis TaxID=1126833 RepID=A0A0D5NIA2_9BACL|nr:oxidoreductase [Paenibacillus beijingensis]AJY74633.1 oxidoreductase [Paenibacillus beijingensis]